MKPRWSRTQIVPERHSLAWNVLAAMRRQTGVMLLIGASLLLAACGAADATDEPTGTTVAVVETSPAGTTVTPTARVATATPAAATTSTPAAPTQTPRPLTTPTPLPSPEPAIGDSVRTDGWVFSITEFETFQRIGDHTAEGMFLYLHLTVSNAGSSAAAFPFDGLIVVDHEDRTFFLAEEATRETLTFDFGFGIDQPFQAGETRNVAAAFDIALDSTGLKLTSPSRVFEISIEHREPPK